MEGEGAAVELDRRRLVSRHNPVLSEAHPTGALTVGNGDLAITVDVSGLQTFPAFHELRPDPHRIPRQDLQSALPPQRPRDFDPDDFQIPLRTQATWGWYQTRPVRPFELHEAATVHPTPRGAAPYLDRMGLQRAGDPITEDLWPGAWFAFNPRRMHLGRLALVRDGAPLPDPKALDQVRTELDLWTGVVTAEYVLDGQPVTVITVADPGAARLATRVVSPLLDQGLGVAWVFDDQPDDLAVFEQPLDASTGWKRLGDRRWRAERTVESSRYHAEIVTTGKLEPCESGAMALGPGGSVEVVVALGLGPEPEERTAALSFAAIRSSAARWWEAYWNEGAMVSFEGSSDPRAAELERRVVLSQYLTAVNSAGSAPPAETGLTYNTWSGNFHLEMHWWHSAHFPLWGRGHLLERSLAWYHQALPSARETARQQGYSGARWPKQTDLSARESPSHIGVFLIWQQPHIIHLLELLHREGRDEDFLAAHYPLVEATAEFMADFAVERHGRHVLPPPLIPAQESYLAHRSTNENPTFELAYWSWALRVANTWRERLGMPPVERWTQVSRGMSHPFVLEDGTYAALATPPYLVREDHPSMLMAQGWLPDTDLVDAEAMAATLDAVWREWNMQTTWGWDYPVLAMAATRLGDAGRAFEALLLPSPKNQFLTNGHNPQMPGFLSLYLPANGGLLAAVAHIVAATGGGDVAPGWRLHAEGFGQAPDSIATDSPAIA